LNRAAGRARPNEFIVILRKEHAEDDTKLLHRGKKVKRLLSQKYIKRGERITSLRTEKNHHHGWNGWTIWITLVKHYD